MSEFDREFSWNDTIQNDRTFEPIPAGEYSFEVKGFERGRFNGSEKMPACPQAIMSIRVDDGKNSTTLKYNLFLHSKTEGMLCSYFAAVGMRKKGQPLRMDFEGSVGRRGRCKVGIRKWTGNNGQMMKATKSKASLCRLTTTPRPLRRRAFKRGRSDDETKAIPTSSDVCRHGRVGQGGR